MRIFEMAQKALVDGIVKRFFYKGVIENKNLETIYKEISEELLLPEEDVIKILRRESTKRSYEHFSKTLYQPQPMF